MIPLKPSPERLALDTYPFSTTIEPRFGDMDALRHLNNVALAGIYEEGRVRFTTAFHHGPIGRDTERPVIAELRIRYLAEGQYPGTLVVAAGVVRIGTTSYVVGQALFQAGRCIGTAETVIVYTADGRPFPIPDPFRASLTTALLPPEPPDQS